MNVFPHSKTFVALLLSSAVTVGAACGEQEMTVDDPDQQGQQQDDQQQDDQQQDDQQDQDELTGNECTEETVDTDCEGGELCEDGYCIDDPDTDGETVSLVEPHPGCADENYDRCSENQDNFDDYKPASYVSHLEIADEDCCIDFTDGGGFVDDPKDVDNLLPDILGLMYERDAANDEIEAGIDQGEINIIIEHVVDDADLDDGELEAGLQYDMYFLFAEDSPDDDEVLLDPVSFDDGTHPHAWLEDAEVVDEDGILRVYAGPGSVDLSIDLGTILPEAEGVDLDLTISNAELRADLVATSVDGGIDLDNGQIGGLVRFQDIAETINEFGTTCDCLDNPANIIEVDGEDSECVLDAETRSDGPDDCDAYGAEEICSDLAQYCGAIPFAPNFADIDTTGDEETDAFSAGLNFEAQAVDIGGVGEGITF